MPRIHWLLIAVLISVAGCNIVGQGKLLDQTLHPRSFEYQKRQATEFDPYSQQERYAGPRDTTMRPRDYSEPIPEPDRARWVTTEPWQTPTSSRW
ncbi:MAG: hypothetical protein ACREHD_20670 [Pirellulales bacterium]